MIMKTLFNLSKIIILTLSFMAVAQSASAAQRCATWGCGNILKVYIDPYIGAPYKIQGWTDDVLTDSYCVFARYRKSGQSWPGTIVPGSRSCGPRANFDYNTGSTTRVIGVRLYRDNGSYLTLYGS